MTSSSRRPFASDVAVVGAGPIGLGVALGLAHRGIRVALFEREPATSIEPRAVSMIDETLRYLESVGALTETVRDDILFDTDTRFFGVNDVELAHVVPPVSTQGYPTKSLFDQPVTRLCVVTTGRETQTHRHPLEYGSHRYRTT